MAKPPFSNNKFSLEGMRDQNGQLMELKVSAWVNPSNDDRDDMEKQKLAAHVSQLIIDNDLTMRLQVEHRSGPDYNAWPTLGYFNLFPNKPREAAAVQQPTAPALTPAPPLPTTPTMPTPTTPIVPGGSNG